MALGIPTSRECFEKARGSDRSHYAKRFLGGWEQYYDLLGADLQRMERLLRRWGVTMAVDASVDSFADLFTRGFDVVILFSHWDKGAVEFSDGLSPVPAIVQRIPAAYAGLLDLCVCHPLDLVSRLHSERPALVVKYTAAEAAPDFWVRFYEIVFHQLHSRDLTYLQVIEEVAGGFLDRGSTPGTLPS
jgi:hypothetical protein